MFDTPEFFVLGRPWESGLRASCLGGPARQGKRFSLPHAQSPSSSYNLGQKVLRSLHFLTHRKPIPRTCYRYGPSPCPRWPCLLSLDQPDFNIVVLGGRGSICSCHCFQELYLKLDIVTSIFLNIFVQDCSSQASGKEVQCLCCDIFFISFLFCVCIFREMGLRTSQKSCPIPTSFKTFSRIYPE